MNHPDEIEAGIGLRRQLDRNLPLAELAFDFGRFIGHAITMVAKITPRLDKLRKRTAALKIGDPLDEATDIGCIINEKQFRKVCAYIDEGIQRKEGLLIFGGLPPKEGPLSEGYFAIPTVFADTAND